MHCHLVVPDLFWPSAGEAEVYHGLRLPAVELLLARGRRSVSGAGGYSRWLAATFGLPGDDPPIAAYRLLGEGIDPGEAQWLCADPVHLAAGIDRVSLADTTTLDVTTEEASALVGALNRHFAGDGLELIDPHPCRWYVPSADEDLVTTSLEAVQGVLLDDALPRGDSGPRWRRRLTEAQMILHDHPVNQAREARNAPPVNGIWPWGGGARRSLAPRRGERWYADDPLARGLAHAADAFAASVPQALERGHGERVAREGVRWYILATASAPAKRGDAPAWRDALAKLESGWFSPLVELLRRGEIGMVSLHAVSPAATLNVEATRSDLRHLWHRPRALPAYLGDSAL